MIPAPTPPPAITLNVAGTRFNEGSLITVHVIAPPNGIAFALICDSPQPYPLIATPDAPQDYFGAVPAPMAQSNLTCPIIAEYVDANGNVFGVGGMPVTILPFFSYEVDYESAPATRSDRHHDHSAAAPVATPTPAPVATPSPAPRTTPAPVSVGKPVYTRDPVAVVQPQPVRQQPAPVAEPVRSAPAPEPVRAAPAPEPVRQEPVRQEPAPVERTVERVVAEPRPKASTPPI